MESRLTGGLPIADGYCRASLDKAAGTDFGGSSVQTQEMKLRQVAAQLGLDLREVVTDNNIGASTAGKRDGFDELLSSYEDGSRELGVLIAFDTSRLGRNMDDKYRLEKLIADGLRIIVIEGGIDT